MYEVIGLIIHTESQFYVSVIYLKPSVKVSTDGNG